MLNPNFTRSFYTQFIHILIHIFFDFRVCISNLLGVSVWALG